MTIYVVAFIGVSIGWFGHKWQDEIFGAFAFAWRATQGARAFLAAPFKAEPLAPPKAPRKVEGRTACKIKEHVDVACEEGGVTYPSWICDESEPCDWLCPQGKRRPVHTRKQHEKLLATKVPSSPSNETGAVVSPLAAAPSEWSCHACKQDIEKGKEVWRSVNGNYLAHHAGCSPEEKP